MNSLVFNIGATQNAGAPGTWQQLVETRAMRTGRGEDTCDIICDTRNVVVVVSPRHVWIITPFNTEHRDTRYDWCGLQPINGSCINIPIVDHIQHSWKLIKLVFYLCDYSRYRALVHGCLMQIQMHIGGQRISFSRGGGAARSRGPSQLPKGSI